MDCRSGSVPVSHDVGVAVDVRCEMDDVADVRWVLIDIADIALLPVPREERSAQFLRESSEEEQQGQGQPNDPGSCHGRASRDAWHFYLRLRARINLNGLLVSRSIAPHRLSHRTYKARRQIA